MTPFDHTTLMAYVDGELDAQTAHEVEQHLLTDPQARRFVENLRSLDNTLQTAYPEPSLDSLHPGLIAAIRASSKAGQDDHTVVSFAKAKTSRVQAFASGNQSWKLLAACLSGLVIGAVGGAEYMTNAIQSAEQNAMATLAQDKTQIAQSIQNTLEFEKSGTSIVWENPETGHMATVTPIRTMKNAQSQFCREYRLEDTLGGETQTTFGVACRNADKKWVTEYEIKRPTLNNDI